MIFGKIMAIVYDYRRPEQKQMKGEEVLEKLLSQDLSDDEFEIYVEPFFIGKEKFCNPDMIVLSNDSAIIIEIKDWKFNNFYKKKTKNGIRIFLKNSDKEIESPIEQVERYRNSLSKYAEVYINKINVLLYFYNETTESAQIFLEDDRFVLGKDKLNYISNLIVSPSSTNKIEEINRIKKLITPDIRQNQEREKFSLTDEQKKWSFHKDSDKSQNHNWHRVSGVAGSGKTVVIARNAADIAKHNLRVLVICFNVTLKSYISFLIKDLLDGFDTRLIKVDNFHHFLFNFIDSKKYFFEEKRINIGECDINERTKNAIKAGEYFFKEQGLTNEEKFDAILIDEAQDLEKEWFYFLTKFLTENDEVLLMADDKQNVYDRKLSWLNETMTGFRGRWGSLTQNIRCSLAPDMILKAKAFSDIFIEPILKEDPDNKSLDIKLITEKNIKTAEKEKQQQQYSLLKREPSNYWEDCKNKDEIICKLFSAYDYLKNNLKLKNNEIAILISCNFDNIKETISQRLGNEVNLKNIFEKKDKENFDFKQEGLTFCNIYNFKGLESKAIIYITPLKIDEKNLKQEHRKTYVALTRAREYCIILNCAEIYKDFGKEWDRLPEILPF